MVTFVEINKETHVLISIIAIYIHQSRWQMHCTMYAMGLCI